MGLHVARAKVTSAGNIRPGTIFWVPFDEKRPTTNLLGSHRVGLVVMNNDSAVGYKGCLVLWSDCTLTTQSAVFIEDCLNNVTRRWSQWT